MIYISVWCADLSDQYLKQISQIGADFVDFRNPGEFPGTDEQGYPDLDGVLSMRKKLQSWGLDINRATLQVSEKIIMDFVRQRCDEGRYTDCGQLHRGD